MTPPLDPTAPRLINHWDELADAARRMAKRAGLMSARAEGEARGQATPALAAARAADMTWHAIAADWAGRVAYAAPRVAGPESLPIDWPAERDAIDEALERARAASDADTHNAELNAWVALLEAIAWHHRTGHADICVAITRNWRADRAQRLAA